MAKDDYMELTGTIIEQYPKAQFKVRLENNVEIIAHLSGKLRQNHINIIVGDEVTVEVSVYDTTKGRIVWRNK